MLDISSLSVSYGKHIALNDVSLSVDPGKIVVLLGANGAGKSSLLKAVSGLVSKETSSSISVNGSDISSLNPHKIVEAGLALVPEGRGLFGDLTVEENLLLGAYAKRARDKEKEHLEEILELFPKLQERTKQVVRTMSGGEQQMLAIARALMSSPEYLLLDEPSLGLAPVVTQELFKSLLRIREKGTGILLVEQNTQASLEISDQGYLIENGQIVGSGSAESLLKDPQVQQAYLGHSADNDEESTMFNVQLLINGETRDAGDGQIFDRTNPVTGEIATKSASATIADAEAAASAAAAAFPEWSAMGPNKRRDYLLKASELLRERTPGFIERMAQETGATATWAGFNAHLAANMLREAASMTTQISGEIIPSDVPGSLAMGVRKPVGVILSLAPWNAPVILGVRSIAMPLACGNTVVLKASELCPATHQLIAEVMKEAGLPDGVVNFITNSPENAPDIVKALIAHPAVRRVNFTGSTRVGKIIASLAAENLKPALLELGGKAPVVILDDADIDVTVNAATFGAFMNQGQICMSTERLIVDEKIADEFVAKLAAKVSTLKTGNPSDPEVIIGSVVNEQAVDRIMELIEDAQSKGGKLLTGGNNDGTIVQATILDHVNSSMRIYSEESFGPLVSIIRVNGVDEAVRIANDSEYGLSSAVFGQDINRAMNVADRIESGICHINGPTVHDEAQMPFGGVKASGYGRFGGKAAIDEFTELRWITIQNGPRHYPF